VYSVLLCEMEKPAWKLVPGVAQHEAVRRFFVLSSGTPENDKCGLISLIINLGDLTPLAIRALYSTQSTTRS